MTSLYHISPPYSTLIIIGCAFLMDIILGDPAYRLHPVRLIGKLIDFFYKLLKDIKISKRFLGTIIVISVLAISQLCYIIMCYGLGLFGILLDIFLCYSFIAFRDLFDHIQPVVDSLNKGDIEKARLYLSRTVGRDTKRLDRDGIIRASIETVAEGFVDGFLSPIFWFFIGAFMGLPLVFMLSYKVINTLDSMLGYKSPELMDIGFASARLDDFMNLVPARISLIMLFVGAVLLRLNARKALYIALRDRLKHSSPNSAHPEAFVAGALRIRLGGPTYYPYGLVEKPWIGDDERCPAPSDITEAMRLIKVSAFISILLFSLVFYIMSYHVYNYG